MGRVISPRNSFIGACWGFGLISLHFFETCCCTPRVPTAFGDVAARHTICRRPGAGSFRINLHNLCRLAAVGTTYRQEYPPHGISGINSGEYINGLDGSPCICCATQGSNQGNRLPAPRPPCVLTNTQQGPAADNCGKRPPVAWMATKGRGSDRIPMISFYDSLSFMFYSGNILIPYRLNHYASTLFIYVDVYSTYAICFVFVLIKIISQHTLLYVFYPYGHTFS